MPDSPEDEVFEYWKTVMNKPRARMDDMRRKAIRARIRDGYTVADLQDAVSGCRLSRFHMGENDQRKQYADIALICRDASHTDQFIENYERMKSRLPDNVVPIENAKDVDVPSRLAELRSMLRRA